MEEYRTERRTVERYWDDVKVGDALNRIISDARYHKFNYMGDVTWVHGQVTDKFERDGNGYVRCALQCVNHRDEVTATADAEAELPRR